MAKERPDKAGDDGGGREPSLTDYAAAAALGGGPDGGEEDSEKGIVCGKCGCQHFDVRCTRVVNGGIRRYRYCRNCGRTRVTFER